MKKNFPATITTYFNLYFDHSKTALQTRQRSSLILTTGPGLAALVPAVDNIVFTDLDRKENIGLKHVFENTYRVEDSVRNIEWRITMDTRTIAGFSCRKAVGRIMDSVYVIAFYTDQIVPNGGPESFSGLPE